MKKLVLFILLISNTLIAAPSITPNGADAIIVNTVSNFIGRYPTVIVYTNNVVFSSTGRVNTAGTTTAGIQEAINALPVSGNINNQLGGGYVTLGPGIFYITDTINTVNNTNPFYLNMA